MKYLITFTISLIIMAASLATATAYFDPLYKTPRANFDGGIPAFGANADRVLDMKLALFSVHPQPKIILGNSRAQKGLNAQTLGQNWFNAAIQGSSISDQIDILKALQSCAAIDEIVITLDMAMFNAKRGDQNGKTLPAASYKHRCTNAPLADLRRQPLYFIDPKNILNILNPAPKNSFNLSGSETYNPAALKRVKIDNDSRSKIRSYFLSAWSTQTAASDFTTKTAHFDHLAAFEALLAYSAAQDISVKVMLLPLHNELLKVKYAKGLWPTYNALRAEISVLAKTYEAPLYDASGPNALTGLPLLKPSKKGFYYKEPSHFTPIIGDQLLKQLSRPAPKTNIAQSTKALKNLMKQQSLSDEILSDICENGRAYYCPRQASKDASSNQDEQ